MSVPLLWKTILSAMLIANALSAAAQNETVLYSFQAGDDGDSPRAGLVADQAGNLYGTTYYGDTDGCINGCGTVFELSPPPAPGDPWNEQVLYRFTGGNDGALPAAGLIFDSAGNLYGTTSNGGTNGDGVVFELSPPSRSGKPWTETVLYSFHGSDGSVPLAGLIFDQTGNLYGTTSEGGSAGGVCAPFGCGTAFELSPPTVPGNPWTETVLHKFGGMNEGVSPVAGLVFDDQGNLYGTTEYGNESVQNGTIFQLAPPGSSGGAWTETILNAFDYSNGSHPVAPLIFDQAGNLYGTTMEGGSEGGCNASHECGVVFELSPPPSPGDPWTENVLFEFQTRTGTLPAAGLIFDGEGNLFGTTTSGDGGDGTVFELSPPLQHGGAWTFTLLYAFPYNNKTNGASPYAPLLMASSGVFYGTTEGGGSYGNGYGTVYAVTIAPIAQFSPTNLNFGNQTVDFTSSPQDITLTNNGNSPLVVTNIAITGANSGDFAQQNDCAQPIPPTDKCEIQVTFTPSSTGTRNASVVITDNAQNGQQSVPVTGNGVLPAVTFNPPALTFATQLIFTQSKPQKVTLTNSGLGILAVSSVNLTGPFRQMNNCQSQNIQPGASCNFSVTFFPTLKGKVSGSVTVTDNAPASPQSFTLSGTATAILVDPTSLNFGTQPVGTSSLPQTVTLSNKGHQPVTMKIGIVGSAAADFTQTNTCGTVLASGASCFVYVTFTPTEKGYRKATLAIEDNGGGSPQEVSLEGYGT